MTGNRTGGDRGALERQRQSRGAWPGSAATVIYPYSPQPHAALIPSTALSCRILLQERDLMPCSSSSHSFTVLHVNTGNGF